MIKISSLKLLTIARLHLLIFIKNLERNWQAVGIVLLTVGLLLFLQIKLDIFQLQPNTLNMGFVGTYENDNLPEEVANLISVSLIEPDEQGRMKGKLVSGWETNNDATIFKFTLHKNLKWSDGTPIKSSDIDLNFPNTEVTFPDTQTIQFKLKESYSPFPSLLTKPVFKKGTLVGTGPYKVVKVEKSRIYITKITLKPLEKDQPDIVVRFYPNEKTASTGFKLGEIQTLSGVSSKELLTNPQAKEHTKTDYNKIVTIFYNTEDKNLANRSLRQALSYSAPTIDGEVEANNPYPPTSWAFNKDVKDYLNKPQEAKTALQRAKESSEDLSKKEIVLTTTPALEGVGQKTVTAWKALGLNAVLRVESGIPQNFQALLITQSIPSDPDQYFLWHSTQIKTNLSKYSEKCCPTSLRVDKNLEDGRRVTNQAERKNSYFDFQRVLLEDSPATFLYFPKYNVIYHKKAESKLEKVIFKDKLSNAF